MPLFIVIVGASVPSLFPTVDELDTEIEVRTLLVDPALDDPEIKSRIPSLPGDLLVPYPETASRFRYDVEPNVSLREANVDIIYVDYGDSRSTFDVMDRVGDYRTEQQWYIYSSDRLDIGELIKDWSARTGRFEERPYGYYTGAEISRKHPEYKLVMHNYSVLAKILGEYLMAGFHQRKIIVPPSPWTLNLYTPQLLGLIMYLKLVPTTTDREWNLEFSENTQYRQIVTECLCDLLATFVVNNKLVTETLIKRYTSWEDSLLWHQISKNLLKKAT